MLASSDPNGAVPASAGAVWAMGGYHLIRSEGSRAGSPLPLWSVWQRPGCIVSRAADASCRLGGCFLPTGQQLGGVAPGSRVPFRVARARLSGGGSEADGPVWCRSQGPFQARW